MKPVCPRCLQDEGEHPLELANIFSAGPDHIVEAILRCGNRSCVSEYPIIDGIPILVTATREYVARDISQIMARSDLSAAIESLLGDCVGPATAYDTSRQQVSAYTWDHWADLDPDETDEEPAPGSVVRLSNAALDLAGRLPAGPVLDAGCAVGRGAFTAAARTQRLTLGVDLNFAMLRVAARALRDGQVTYPRRRVGLVYDRRQFDVTSTGADQVDFWACDVNHLPFRPGAFAAALGLNVLDSVSSPAETLMSLAACLRVGGKAMLACPFDWSLGATPVEAWLGGHSQRGEQRGASEPVLRMLLTPGAHPAAPTNLTLVAETPTVPWRVRLHDRAAIDYRTHLLVAEKLP